MNMETAKAVAYAVVAVEASVGLIIARHCWPRWKICLVWTGGRLNLYKYKWRGAVKRERYIHIYMCMHLTSMTVCKLILANIFSIDSFSSCSFDSSVAAHEEQQVGVTEEDLKALSAYIDEKDGGPPWHLMMDHSTSTLSFRAWRRDPKVPFQCLNKCLKVVGSISGVSMEHLVVYLNSTAF